MTPASTDSSPTVDFATIDGVAAARTLAPSSEEECVAFVSSERAAGLSAVPVGGGTALAQGNPLACSEWTALTTAALASIREYSPDDMVVTAGSGTTLAKLREVLAGHGQFVPLDCPDADRAALGGIVATNAHGLWRPAYGLPRDRLLGVRVVLADGSVVKGGGKVVKNVAGYDLCKLFAGSWGTLGLITEVTFKTNPLPPSRIHVNYRGANLEVLLRAALRVHCARLDPVYMAASATDGSACLSVGVHGGDQTTTWQSRAIDEMLTEDGLERLDGGPDEDSVRHWIVASSATVRARITVRPTDVPAVAGVVLPVAERMAAHAQTGVIEAAFRSATEPEFGALRTELARVVSGRGHLVWTALPPALKAGLDVWGPARQDHAIMRKLKQALDPHGLFSPGRSAGRM